MNSCKLDQDNWLKFQKQHIWNIQKNCTKLCIPVKDYMEFPIEWDRSMPLKDYMELVFENYKDEIITFCKNIIEVKKVCALILEIMEILKGDNIEHNGCFEKFEELTKILKISVTTINKLPAINYYRLRGDKENLLRVEDFYHVPYSKPYVCSPCRFSMSGVPALYLGYSENVCIAECGKPFGSMSQFKFKKGTSIDKIVDLTFKNQKDLKMDEMFKLWPFLAACYVEVPRKIDETLGCVRYREEYLFPQAFASYLRCKKECNGIIYYSVRNRFLDPCHKDYNNVVLFTKKGEGEDYDKDLMNKFTISNFHNIKH